MGIVSGIFWIVFGILYVIYRLFKDDPEQTTIGVLSILIVIVGSIGFSLLSTVMWKIGSVAAVIWSALTFGFLGYFIVRRFVSRQEKDDRRWADLDRVHEILDEMEYSEEEFEAYLKKWRKGTSMAQMAFNHAKTPEDIAKGREKALLDFYISTGMYRKAREQMLAEKNES